MIDEHSTDQQRLAQAQDAIRNAHEVVTLAFRSSGWADDAEDQQCLTAMRAAEHLIRQASELLDSGVEELVPGSETVLRQTYGAAAFCQLLAGATAARIDDSDGLDVYALLSMAADQSRALLDAANALPPDGQPIAA